MTTTWERRLAALGGVDPGIYSRVGHDHGETDEHAHNDLYSPLGHNHSGLYAPVAHTHEEGGALPPGGLTNQALLKASDLDGDVAWGSVSGPNITNVYNYYRHDSTDRNVTCGSWQNVAIGVANNWWDEPGMTIYGHSVQIKLARNGNSSPDWFQLQWMQVETSDGTGPSPLMMWPAGKDEIAVSWFHPFKNEADHCRLQIFVEGSGTVLQKWVIIKSIRMSS